MGKGKWMKLNCPVTFIFINKYSKTEILAFLLLTQLGNKAEWSTIQGVIGLVISNRPSVLLAR